MSKKITLKKPEVKVVRIRVQDIEGAKATHTKSMTLYNTDAETVFGLIEKHFEEMTGESRQPEPAKKEG